MEWLIGGSIKAKALQQMEDEQYIDYDKGTLNFARWHSFRVTYHSFGHRPTKIGMQGSFCFLGHTHVVKRIFSLAANINMKLTTGFAGVVELLSSLVLTQGEARLVISKYFKANGRFPLLNMIKYFKI